MNGYNDGTFKPEDKLSREELATLLDRTFGLFVARFL
ncbi:S-layer homology domain-containing protein [Paenibacillus sp. T3-5-0-4]|nr:S-layer homology domain-containing protein [Paenibacillus endoradicis]